MRLPEPTTVNKWNAIIWTLLLIPSLLWLRDSVPWLVFISVYAIISSSLSGLRDRRVECRYGCPSCAREGIKEPPSSADYTSAHDEDDYHHEEGNL